MFVMKDILVESISIKKKKKSVKSCFETIYETHFFPGFVCGCGNHGSEALSAAPLPISKHTERESAKLTGIACGRVCLHF